MSHGDLSDYYNTLFEFHQQGYRIDEIEALIPFELDFLRTMERQYQARMAEHQRQIQAIKDAQEKVRY